MKKIKPLEFAASRQSIRIVLLVMAIASNIWYLVDHSRINPDESYSLAQALSLLEGSGLTLQSAKPQDVSEIITVYNPRFPPGIAITFAIFTALFNNPGIADFVLEIIATFVFFLCWAWIISQHKKQISFPGELFVWVLWIFFPAPLMAGILTGHTSETLSLSLFMTSVVLSGMLVGKTDRKSMLMLGSLTGILSGVAASLRYLYWPMLAVLPTAIFVFGLGKRRLKLVSGAILTNLVFSGFFLSGMMLLNLNSTDYLVGYDVDLYGQVETRLPPAQFLHWEHLNRTIPFPLFTLGVSDPSFMAGREVIEAPPALPFIPELAWLISGVVIAAFILYTWATLSPWLSSLYRASEGKSGDSISETMEFISLTGLITVVLIFSTLAYLSIDMELHQFRGGWVPVMELRYFSATFVFFTLGIGYLISQIKDGKWVIKFLSYVANLIVIPLLFLVGAWRFQIGYQQIFIPDTYFTGAERFERETRLLSELVDNGDVRPPVVVIYPEKDLAIRRMAQSKDFVVSPLKYIPPDPALSTNHAINALLVYRDSEPESIKAYFANLVDMYNGTCKKIGRFTGCHILLVP